METRFQPTARNCNSTQHPPLSLARFQPSLVPPSLSSRAVPLAATSNARFLFWPQGWRPGCHEQGKTNDGGEGRISIPPREKAFFKLAEFHFSKYFEILFLFFYRIFASVLLFFREISRDSSFNGIEVILIFKRRYV